MGGKWSEEKQKIASEGISAFTAPIAAALPEAYDFSRYRVVLDLGGGTGSFLVALLGRYQELHGTLYELPETAAVARQLLSRSPEGARQRYRAATCSMIHCPRARISCCWPMSSIFSRQRRTTQFCNGPGSMSAMASGC
jgi:hypothetical protein